jgi:predicted metallo-beta-lactamase superfamily hydrolase
MKIIPIASDSLGVRSMATYVETNDSKILIDPSAALGPKRYGLPPHDKEHKVFNETKKKISEIAQKCEILTISHYHYDHYNPEEEFFKEKKVFLKEISIDINKSQSQRGADFKNKVEKNCELIYCDNSKHRIGDTEIIFSPPFFHGPENIRLGYVIMTTVNDGGKRILHASDVQGPVSKNATKYIIDQKPDILIIDGPPTNMLGFRFSKKNLQKASENLVKIIEKLKCEIILDHHIIRDLKYKEAFPDPYRKGGVKLKTFAEYLGKENNTLEANRKNLWGK